jgi:hypothetical protein
MRGEERLPGELDELLCARGQAREIQAGDVEAPAGRAVAGIVRRAITRRIT